MAEERGLTVSADMDVHEYLSARWVGRDDYPATGVRKLADWFNKRLLREVYTDAGRNVTDIRISSEYEVLASDDTLKREEVIDDLASDGIDGEALADDFVSRSTMRRHLKNCLDVTKEPADTGSHGSDWEIDQIRYGREKFEGTIREAIQSLDNKDIVPGGADADLEVSVFLSCQECSTQVRLQTALDRGFICKEHLGPANAGDLEITQSLD